jgi:putative endonuclease
MLTKLEVADRWFAYFLSCADGSLYCGCTNDLNRRVAAHNAGKGARYTRSRLPVTLVWKKGVEGRSQALSLEATLKGLSRAQKLQLVRQRRHVKKVRVNSNRARLLINRQARSLITCTVWKTRWPTAPDRSSPLRGACLPWQPSPQPRSRR